MDGLFWFHVFTRWLHITSTVLGVGTLLFVWLILRPVLAAEQPSARQELLRRLLPRVKLVIHATLGLLLLTGFYNYFMGIPHVRTLPSPSLYHQVIGLKMVLVFVLFGIVSAMLATAPASANMQEGRWRWLTLIIVLALVILVLSNFLRRLWAGAV